MCEAYVSFEIFCIQNDPGWNEEVEETKIYLDFHLKLSIITNTFNILNNFRETFKQKYSSAC